jgi:hypothetical protein
MGYDLDLFQGFISEELKCPVCCGVLEEPVQAVICEHTFCLKCIQEWLKSFETCPVDRDSLCLSQLEPVPRIVRNMLNHLQIKCKFEKEGCDKIVNLEDLHTHAKSCIYNPEALVPCLSACGAMVPKNQLDKHDCIQDLRSLISDQQKEIMELKFAISALMTSSEEQKQLTSHNASSLSDLSERYEHLKLSIASLKEPIQQVLDLALKSDSNLIDSSNIKEKLTQETSLEIYIVNIDKQFSTNNLREYLTSNGVTVISCKKALHKGWKNDFRVTIFKSDRDKVLKPDLWPCGVTCFVCGDYYSTKIEGSKAMNELLSEACSKSYSQLWFM